ncbi:MAG: A/G-specific adenine glycosylase [Algoriphagus sp.]|uniref:A/G-specific adenine glycosylase n=1 Tax=Algoriphagus sp. TaxID=1872435 RepID=UPI001845A083|nr:A/G-specific adenine glycosylase [Algoriphagus sp.]NVJ86622.1 A/G-specific adenine glycosylase [Algoriphagus sp.]
MNPKSIDNQAFSNSILNWYQSNPRELPWRGTQDPYKIWLSEIILQQTRVAQGLPYYNKFVNQYPTVRELAEAPEEEVLRLWQGLGYYSRARNLHFCAKQIWFEREGDFPKTHKELLLLKGVGDYTAAAIASFAFEEKKAVLDGNVFRVLARFFGIETDIASGKGKREFQELADQVIPAADPGEYNQAIMDFGARQCVPVNPDCNSCPLKSSCFAFRNQLVSSLPVKVNKTKIRDRHFHYFVIRCGENWVWKRRASGDIWEGLFDFPMAEKKNQEEAHDFQMPLEWKGERKFPKKYRHILSHQRLYAEFSEIEVDQSEHQNLEKWAKEEGFLLVEEERIEELAKPKLIVNFLNDQGF